MAFERLEHVPVTLFSAVMGIGGTALAWRRAARVWGISDVPFLVLLVLSVGVLLVLLVLYAAKWARYPQAAKAELRHPLRMAFAPTVTIAVLIVATALTGVADPVASVLWWIGAIGHLAGTVAVLSVWFARPDIGAAQVTPAWFIPIVGNVITPLAAPAVGSTDLGWFAFGVGMVFWLALLPLLLQRILTADHPLPERLLPSLAIFVAPPSVGLLSWQSLTGRVDDPVGRILFAAAMFFVVLVLAQIGRLRRVPFALPYWAYTFPLAAASVAAIAMADALPGVLYDIVAIALLAGASVVLVWVGALTVRAIGRGEIFVPEV